MDGFPLPGVFYALRAPICVSATSTSGNQMKNVFRPWPKDEKQEKLRFGHGRRTGNAKNRPSSADEMRKTMKMVCRRPTTEEQREKMAVVGRRNEKNG